MEVETRGLVLHTLRYNDTTLIADVLTESDGFRGFAVRVSSARRSTGRHRLFQPLSRLRLCWDEHGRSRLPRPRGVEGVPWATIPYAPNKAAVALFLAEFLRAALRGEPPQPQLFSYVWQSLDWLDTSTSHYANFHLVFLLRLSRFLGFYPNIEGYRDGAFFDMISSTFTLQHPPHPHYVEPALAAHLPTLMRMEYGNMRVFRFSGAERSRLLAFVVDYYRLHVPSFPELRSLAVLRDVFG